MKPAKTKIVCSMGPTTENDEVLARIIQNGMNVARFNFSHGTQAYHKSQMERVRAISKELNIPVALMMDTKGPEIRTGNTAGDKLVSIRKGETVLVKTDGSLTTPSGTGISAMISINWKQAIEKIGACEKPVEILIADGLLELDVVKVEKDLIITKAANSAEIGSKKNVNLIGIHANLPIMSEQDRSIFDGTDAVMLSGETANGAYPAKAVETMARIAKTVEESAEYHEKMLDAAPQLINPTIGQAMAQMAYLSAESTKSTAILVPTLSGHTATMISTFRPVHAIIAVTPKEDVQRKLLLNWGIIPLCMPKIADDSEEMIQNAVKIAIGADLVRTGDKVIVCAGIPLQSPIPVNTIRVLLIGNILARGRNGGHPQNCTKRTGRIVKANTPQEAFSLLRKKEGEMLLCPVINEDWIPILRIVDGVVVTGKNELPVELISKANPSVIWISEIGNSSKCLETGITVTVDGKDLLVYEGIN